MDNAAELQVKLLAYQSQLNQVESLLALEPLNPQLLNLKRDLFQVISLTEDLLDVGEPEFVRETGDDISRTQDQGSLREAFSVGSRVEALSRETWYPSVIKQVSDDTQSFTIEYIGFGGQDTKTLAMLRQIRQPQSPVGAAEARVGLKCRGLYMGDMNWYDCVIEGITANGYNVKFIQYGNKEEVPLEYLQKYDESVPLNPVDSTLPSGSKPARVLPKAAINEDGTFRIPDNLKLQHTDSEAEKIRKRNKVKALKLLFKQQQIDKESVSKQNSWKTFASSKGTKRVSGSMKSVRKESIFKSPDSLDGRVGVIGSGQGMTDFEQKKKFKKG